MGLMRVFIILISLVFAQNIFCDEFHSDENFKKSYQFLKSKEALYQAHLRPLKEKSEKVFDYVLGLMSQESQGELEEDYKLSPLVKLDIYDQKRMMEKILKQFNPSTPKENKE